MLELKAVTIWLAGAQKPLFEPVSCRVGPGEILSVMAPSGSGKSSLLDAIGGHLAVGLRATGEVWLDGQRVDQIAALQRRIGLLFQDALLFPHLSVSGNLGFGLAARGAVARAEAISQALDSVGLSGFQNRDPATLSGGERTRVALMRTVLARPKALLLDEPFAKLDGATRQSVRAVVFEHVKRAGVPAILVTHDESDVVAAGGPVLGLAAVSDHKM
jgi:putative thiamine transport system ATP-binding protein